MKDYSNILEKLYESPWMITKPALELIESIIQRRIDGKSFSEEELRSIQMSSDKNPDELQLPDTPSVATINLQGPIFPKANMMTRLSGASSGEQFVSDFKQLMNSDKVTGIIINTDSPGGSADGIKEMADVVYQARESGDKPISALANFNAHSAGYYVASQAENFFGSDSGYVGCIGVIGFHRDQSEADAKSGVKTTILSVGKHKAEGNPHEPLSDSAKEHHLSMMQDLYDDFVSDVARGRGVSEESVLEDFGQGRSYRAKTALKRGMIDGIKTYDVVLADMAKQASDKSHGSAFIPGYNNSNEGETKMEITPEILELLGLSEDATPEMVQTAVTELIAQSQVEPAPAPVVEAEAVEFAKKFPKQAAEMERLLKVDRMNSAKLFAGNYESFVDGEKGKTGFGFSSVALTAVEEMHLKIADGLVTHDDFKNFLDTVASGNAIVDYRELGSKRGEEDSEAESSYEAGIKLRDMALKLQTEEGLSYGDALSKVMSDNPELTALYRSVSGYRGGDS